MNQTVLQIILAVSMLITTTIAGFLPIKVVRILERKNGKGRGPLLISLLSCFSGGVFMATVFLDIFPNIHKVYEEYKADSGLETQFPLPQLITCLGFFLVYLIEEFCLRVFGGQGHSHGTGGHSHEEKGGKPPLDPLPLPRKPSTNKMEQVLEESLEYALSDNQQSSMLKSITFAVAISFHSLLEGFALGVQDSTSGVVTLFISLLIHKAIESFVVGLQVSKGAQGKLKIVIITILIYSLMTPIGSICGMLIQTSSMDKVAKEGLILGLESLAAGTFIYVTFLEVLAPEKENEHNSLLQLLFIILGFVLITILQIIFMAVDGTLTTNGHLAAAAMNSTMIE